MNILNKSGKPRKINSKINPKVLNNFKAALKISGKTHNHVIERAMVSYTKQVFNNVDLTESLQEEPIIPNQNVEDACNDNVVKSSTILIEHGYNSLDEALNALSKDPEVEL